MVQKQKKHNVMIKGTKDGLILHLDDNCSFEHLLEELKEKLYSNFPSISDGPNVPVSIKVGNRYLSTDQENTIKEMIVEKKNLIINYIESNVITKQKALEMKKEAEIISISKVVRSGQVIQITGDLLLIGDVNPGGCIMATGNIFVLGSLKGIAHAGYRGNTNAVVIASHTEMAQVRIADEMILINKIDGAIIRKAFYIEDDTDNVTFKDINVMYKQRPELNRI